MDFRSVWVLFLIPIVLGIVYVFHRRSKDVSFSFPTTDLLTHLPTSWKVRFGFIPFVIRLLVLILFMIALAGPRDVLHETKQTTEGIDIVLAIDSSGSMAGEDFEISGQRMNRLNVVKKVVSDFVEERPSDQIGLVAFAGLAYTVCPLTTDTEWLQSNLVRIELGVIQDGTAVGSAITSAITRLQNSQAKSKIVILLTDGVNNAGEVDPIDAAKAAKTLGIKIYTIGAGTNGYVPYPTTNFFGQKVYQNVLIDIDEEMLTEVADITGGQYFRATDTENLKAIYKSIDQLEKTEIEEIGYFEYKELFPYFLCAALILLIIELILTNTLFLKVP